MSYSGVGAPGAGAISQVTSCNASDAAPAPTSYHTYGRYHRGPPRNCRIDLTAPNISVKPSGNAAREGLRYEQRVLKALRMKFPNVLDHVTFRFSSAGRKSKIIVDALICSPNLWEIVLVEIKRQHTYDAFNQLRFYFPVVSAALPFAKISMLEVCEQYVKRDLLKPVRFVQEADEVWNLSHTHHNVWGMSNRELKYWGAFSDGVYRVGNKASRSLIR